MAAPANAMIIFTSLMACAACVWADTCVDDKNGDKSLVQLQAKFHVDENEGSAICTEVLGFRTNAVSHEDTASAKVTRLSGIGSVKFNEEFDLTISHNNPTTGVSVKSNAWVQVNSGSKSTSHLTMSFVEKGTSTPVELQVAKMILCDIDKAPNDAKETYVLSADAFYFYDVDSQEFNYAFDKNVVTSRLPTASDSTRFVRRVTAERGGKLQLQVVSTMDGHGCDNPTGPNSLNENFDYDANRGKCANFNIGVKMNQAKRCFMFELQNTNGFDVTFTTGPGSGGRRLMLAGASAYFDTTEPCPAPASTSAAPASTSTTKNAVHAIGDPHLQNILGQHFDLMQPGRHTLMNIPRTAPQEDALFRVTARADRLGGNCADIYFEALNVTGQWVEATTLGFGGLRFSADSGSDDYMGSVSDDYMARWLTFGPVDLKVVRGHLLDGSAYLNLFLKNVKQTGHHVGGLLGEDDHEQEATPSATCQQTLALVGLQAMPNVGSLDSTSQATHGSIAQVLAE